MIIRVLDEERASTCDILLTKLIQDERQYDNSIDKDFVVNNYFKNIIKNENNILLCYEEDNIIKGYIYLKPVNNDSQNCYLIDGLYVDNEYRNKGIATKLIENALNVIKETNVAVVDINVMANNSVAISLYKRFGFNEFRISLRKNI
jgi:ribosomal protein S18 acetylase RimI-like enzyme